MSDYMDKLLRGETPTVADWQAHLIEAHAKAPSMSPAAFADCRNGAGLNSYEWLAETTAEIPSAHTLVDLACGDGFLIPILQKRVPASANFLGIDFSDHELDLARKRGLPRTTFRRSPADQTHLPDASVDAVFCHMALMLMLPVEPVLGEIHRILGAGGIFAGVVGGGGNDTGLLAKIQKSVGQYLGQKFSQMAKPVTGDPRAQTDSGLRALLGGFREVQITDDTFEASLDPSAVWDHIKNMYILGALPAAAQAEVRNSLHEMFVAELKAKGELILDFPLRKFVAFK